MRLTLTGLLLLLLVACSDGGYYLQAAKGQYNIFRKRQPIEKLLASKTLSSQQKLNLSRILQIRRYASKKLALPENNSYHSYVELGRPYPLWNVVAAPEFSLKPKTWCFPVAGCVSYRGYFVESAADSQAQQLAKKGYDTLVAGVPAYSTLTWFDDPVLSSFSNWPAPSVARLIFHELAHQQLYLPGDSDFNEAFATSVELAGTKRWLSQFGTPRDQALFRRQQKREADFIAWATHLQQQLKQLYAASLADPVKREQKKKLLSAAKQKFQQLKKSWNGYKGYDKWVKTLNNAHLVSLKTYRRLLPAFLNLLQERQGDFKAYYAACRKLSELPTAQREQRLTKLLPTAQLTTRRTQ